MRRKTKSGRNGAEQRKYSYQSSGAGTLYMCVDFHHSDKLLG